MNAVHDANGLTQYAIATIQPLTSSEQIQLDLQEANTQLKKQVTEQTTNLIQANILLNQEIDKYQKLKKTLNTQIGARY